MWRCFPLVSDTSASPLMIHCISQNHPSSDCNCIAAVSVDRRGERRIESNLSSSTLTSLLLLSPAQGGMDVRVSPERGGVEMNETSPPGRDRVEMDWLNLREELIESEEERKHRDSRGRGVKQGWRVGFHAEIPALMGESSIYSHINDF